MSGSPAITAEDIGYSPRGQLAELWRADDPEILVEGPAGTGKSFAIAHYLNTIAATYPGARILIARKTRKALSEAFLATWERVLGPHHFAMRGASRTNRSVYEYDNGSRVVLGSLEEPERFRSAEFDVVYVNEATEISERDWEELQRSLRNRAIPHFRDPARRLHIAIADCNPDAPTHWLNVRCNEGRMRRIVTSHADNPTVDADYLRRLSMLTGVRRERLYLGRWVVAEGAIYPEWETPKHIVGEVPWARIAWTIGSMDWGYTAPGVLQWWGVSRDKDVYLLAEWYHTERALDWWADRIVEAAREYAQFDCRGIVADPSGPGNIAMVQKLVNERLKPGIPGVAIRPADNDVNAGIDAVRQMLIGAAGRPKLYAWRDCRRVVDALLQSERRPLSVIDEIPDYTWDEPRPNGERRDVPNPLAIDHGLDAMRYMAMAVWPTKPTTVRRPKPLPPDAAYYTSGDHEVYERMRRRGFDVPDPEMHSHA